MPKVKSINLILLFGMQFLMHFPVQAQPVLGQVIEQVKRNKVLQLMPQSSGDVTLPANKIKNPPVVKESYPPVLWSMSGINASLTAELLIDEQIYRIKVAPGRLLPGGWSVLDADLASMRIKNGKKLMTLSVPAPGASSAEYPALDKDNSNLPLGLQSIQGSLSQRGFPLEFINPETRALSEATQSLTVETSRQAASNLPLKP
jgi:hypothetical protein